MLPDQQVLDSLVTAHQHIKRHAIAQIEQDEVLESWEIDTIRALFALIQSVKKATGMTQDNTTIHHTVVNGIDHFREEESL